jgi:DNA-binding transcriptional regulator YhcF (GntR family)
MPHSANVESVSQASEPVEFGIVVDRRADVPIGVQLAWALRTRIGDGRFKPGQRLPGLREVAEEIGVNVNTVRAVYQRLEQEGLIDSQQGSGTFVGPTPLRPSAVGAIAADAARAAQETGVDPREVAAALYVSPGSAQPTDGEPAERPPSGDARSGGPGRRRLRTQIAALERTLGEIEAEHPGLAPAASRHPASIGPALLDAEDLEQVRTSLVRRLSTVQAAIDAHLQETLELDRRTRADAARKRLAAQPADASAPATPKRGRAGSGVRPAPAGA